jgi:hypothetical protein
MNMAHGCGFPAKDFFWTGTYFEYLPNEFEFFELAEDSNTRAIKISKTDVVVNGKKKRFPKPKRRMVFFPIDSTIYSNYLKNYKGEEPFKDSPPMEEIIQLAYNLQQR